jgi:hypothetical protein
MTEPALRRGELTATTLALPADLTWDEWTDYGHQLDRDTQQTLESIVQYVFGGR